MVTEETFIKRLAHTRNYTEHYALIDSYTQQQDTDKLTSLLQKTISTYSLQPPNYAPRAIAKKIVQSLALTIGGQNAETAFQLAQQVNQITTPPLIDIHQLIAKITSAQTTNVIEGLMQTVTDIESLALLLHEAILQDKLSSDSARVRHVAKRLQENAHPLAVLPLTLLPLENQFRPPNYSLWGASYALPFGPTNTLPHQIDSQTPNKADCVDMTTPERSEQVISAVQNWLQESNGKAEVRVFQCPNLQASELVNLLPSLPMSGLQQAQNGRFVPHASAARILDTLFSAASTGGAYNRGEGGAYGRLRAWQSLAGLMGSNHITNIPLLAAKTNQCEWLVFDTDHWFYQVAWDIGIGCFNPQTQELALLVATDTD